MLYLYISLSIISLCLIGYIRSQVLQLVPAYIIQLSSLVNRWINDDGWIGRISILFLPFIIVYNVLGWVVYGITSLLSVIVFLLQKIWWLILWIWNEIIIAIFYSIIRMIWHYSIICMWHFFKNTFTHIASTVRQIHIIHAVKSLLYIFGTATLFILAFAFWNHPIILVIAGICTVLMYQWKSLHSIAHLLPSAFSASHVKPSFKKGLIWLGIAVGGSGALVAAMWGQKYFIISSIAVPVTIVLTPFVVAGIVFAIGIVNCYPAYVSENHEGGSITDYLKSILFRLPKLIVSIPFQVLGISIVSIIPAIIIFIFNAAITQVSGDDTIEWGKKILKIGNHIPNIQENIKRKKTLQDELASFTPFADSVQTLHVEAVKSMEQKLLKAESLRNKIDNLTIHTESDVHYTGESQWFSVPEIPGCADYAWSVKNNSTGELIPFQSYRTFYENDYSSIIYVSWTTPGEYTVALTPKNSCGSSNEISRVVNIEGIPRSVDQLSNPVGKTNVCQGETVTYQTSNNFASYEWELPSGTSAENSNSSSINVTWGSLGGTLRVRGVSSEGAKSAWKGINVYVGLLPGSEASEPFFTKDEEVGSFKADHPFEFITRAAANDSIEKLKVALGETKANQELHLKEINQIKENLNNSIDSVNGENFAQVLMIIGKLIVAAALVFLLSLLFSCAYIYHLIYNFHMYSFKQDNQHFWESLLSEIKSKNSNQPLLGIFVIIIISTLPLLIAWL